MPEDNAPSPGAVAEQSPASNAGDTSVPHHDVTRSNDQQSPSTNGDRDASSPEAKTGDQQRAHKRLSPYERVKRQRAELRQREALIQQREHQIAQAERARNQPEKPPYTLAELKQYRQAWNEEAPFDPEKADLVKKADAKIKEMEALEAQEHQGTRFIQEWHRAEKELYDSDSEFMRPGTRLDRRIRAIMESPDGNIYRGHERGIIAVYHRAKMELLESDHRDALAEIQQLKEALKRSGGLTSLSGGAPGRIGSGNRVETLVDFKKLSSAEMRKHLLTAGKGQQPWL